jgi:hypothetical protein
VAVLVAAACVLAGCGTSDDRGEARDAAEALYAAVARHDGKAACAQLDPDARKALEDREASPCPEAVLDLRLRGSRAGDVEVYVDEAQVRLVGGDTVFVGETDQGWRVSAAGCRGGGVLEPAECEVQA